MSPVDTNGDLLIIFAGLFSSDASETKLQSVEFLITVLKWFKTAAVPLTKRVTKKTELKLWRRKSVLNDLRF